jgi:hypothetical protein
MMNIYEESTLNFWICQACVTLADFVYLCMPFGFLSHLLTLSVSRSNEDYSRKRGVCTKFGIDLGCYQNIYW